jgi:hypothetical protein
MATWYSYSPDVVPGDIVRVRWGRFGQVSAKVLAVYADGLKCTRWNKRRGCWTSPKRYYITNNRRGWIEHDQADRTSKETTTP